MITPRFCTPEPQKPDLNRPVAKPRLHWLFAALAGFGLWATPALALPDQLSIALEARLEALDAALATAAANGTPPDTILAVADFADLTGADPVTAAPPRFSPAPTDAVQSERLNMRLMLIMLSQAHGAEGNSSVLNAQTEAGADALVIRKGRVTLAQLRRILQDSRLQRAVDDGPLVLKVPLVIWAGASLALQPGEELHLSRADGAFVINFGQLQIDGATVRSVGDRAPRSPGFVPFITTADGGTVQVQDAWISGLGFGKTLKYSGFTILHNALKVQDSASWVRNTTFQDLVTVSISADWEVVVAGNHFRDMRGASLIVSRSRGVRVVSNLFSGKMPTNAIVFENGSARARVEGNIVLGGNRAGIVVRNGSTSALITRNVVWHRDGGGIALSKSDCGRISENLVVNNAQKGIEVRGSRQAEVQGNTILDNHSAGIWVSAQPSGTRTAVRGNILIHNGSGLAGAKGEHILLEGNDFTQQFPQFVSGDLAAHSISIAENLQGALPLVLASAGSGAIDPDLPACDK